MQTKICTKCKIEQKIEHFYKKTSNKDGRTSHCKTCTQNTQKEFYKKNSERIRAKTKEYVQNNQTQVKQARRDRYNNNREDIKAQIKRYRKEHQENVRQTKSKYYNANKEYISQHGKTYRLNNQVKLKKTKDRYVSENHELILARQQVHRRENPGRFNAYNAKRRMSKLQRTPKWSNMEEIKNIYELSSYFQNTFHIKYNVDHILPLQSKFVSGLHVVENLQIISKKENNFKYNTFVPYGISHHTQYIHAIHNKIWINGSYTTEFDMERLWQEPNL